MSDVMKRGISEPVQRVYNPLPPEVTDEEILKKAKLDHSPSQRGPFDHVWKFSGNLEGERIHLRAGESVLLRKSEADAIVKELGPLGVFAVSVDAPASTVRQRKMEALRRAEDYFRMRGRPQLNQLRRTRGITAEEMEDYRHDDWAYYVNEAKAHFVGKELAAVRREPVTETEAA